MMDVSRELYPFQGRYLDIGGHRLHTLDEGSGPAVVMVHGNPSWSFYYRNLARVLSDQHRVIVPDHIGCGYSDKPPLEEYPYTLDRRVSDFSEAMERLDLGDDITVVVHDWGGMIGMAWAVENAARVKRIVVLNTAAFPLPAGKRLPWTLGLVRNTRIGAWLVLRFNAFSRGATTMAVTRHSMPPEIRKAYCAPYDSVANRIATLRFVQDIPLQPTDPSWTTLEQTASKLECFADTPVLICWGAKDFVFDDLFLAEWQQRWPHAEVHRFEDCGHYILEDASDEVVGLVQEFIQAHPLPNEMTSTLAHSVNVAAALTEMAALQPDALAIAAPPRKGAAPDDYVRWTYRELNDASDRIARGLPSFGIGKGTRTALMVTPGLELFALTFGLFKLGAVPIMIDPGIGIRNLGICLAEAEPEAFIGEPKAHMARILLGWGRKTIRSLVTVGPRLFWGGATLKAVLAAGAEEPAVDIAPTQSDDLAAILFTSGSTGVPKGVIYRHGNFIAQVEAIRTLYDIQPGEVDLPTFPLFGLFDPALGMTTVIPDMDPTRPARVDPRRILPAMEAFGVTNMFGSPALLNTVGRYGERHGVKIPGLKRVISAGAPVPIPVMERFLGMLDDDARVVTPYGATESLPVCSIGSEEIFADAEIRERTASGTGVCVGRPLPNVELRIAEITDEVETEIRDLPQGEIGEVVVSSRMTTHAYHNRDQSTALAKIPLDQGRVAHRMGDLGFLDEKGRLWYCGRKSHRVVTPEQTLFTDPCELVFNTHPSVHRSALVGVEQEGQLVPVICVELETGTKVDPSELRELAASQPHTAQIQSFLFHPGFPVDIRHNAKIKREILAVWAAEKLK